MTKTKEKKERKPKKAVDPEIHIVFEERSHKTKRGRPQKFDPDYAVEVIEEEIAEYLANRKKNGQYWEEIITNPTTGAVTLRGKPFTTVNAIALMCGVDVKTFIRHVEDKNEDGSLKNVQLWESYNRFKDLGQLRLIEGGAAGAYAPNYVQFVGNVNYGMIPKQQVEQTVEITAIDKRFAELDEIYKTELDRVEQQKAEMAKRKAELDAMDVKS